MTFPSRLFAIRRAAMAGLITATLAIATGCNNDTTAAPTTASAPVTTTAPAATAISADPAPMHFDSTTLTLKDKPFNIELALSGEQQERGLMYRTSMPDDRGMLFVFDKPQTLDFWMKNTRIPLDIIFMDSDGKVLRIDHRKPLDETGMGPDAPAQFVIELNVGMADKLGLKTGDKIAIPQKYLKGG